MAFKVSLSYQAILDLNDIYESISASTSRPAASWFLGLRDTVFSLQVLPNRGTPIRDKPGHRQLTYGNKPHIYRIIYKVLEEDGEVAIVEIRHGARAPFSYQT